MATITFAQPKRIPARKRLRILSVWLASAFAMATLGGADGTQAADFPLPTFTGRDGMMPAQASPAAGKKASLAPKQRKVRCGGPGVPDCPE